MPYGELDALADLSAFPELGDPVGAPGGAVRCQVCAVDIDIETGAPLGPVTDENVRAVQEYATGAVAAEFGGQPLLEPELELGAGGPPPF